MGPTASITLDNAAIQRCSLYMYHIIYNNIKIIDGAYRQIGKLGIASFATDPIVRR